MTRSEQFFYEQAGYSYDPKTETPEQGRERCASALAAAEHEAKARAWFVEWVQEQDPDLSWMSEEEMEQEHEVECAILKVECSCCGGSRVLASLGNITDAGPEYRRVVEAELALQALEEEQR